jgi:UDP-2,4-diacetamido-2,4,6-trideoxy-beta-L-altropyranose hydrolase
MSLLMRDVSIQDSADLLEWRNDPYAREFSHTQGLITPETHDAWLKNRIKLLPNEPFFAFTSDLGKVGFTRFDFDKSLDTYRVAILVNPLLRGRGLGKLILSLSIDDCLARKSGVSIYATVHKNNQASNKIFFDCGFHELGMEGNFLIWKLESHTKL